MKRDFFLNGLADLLILRFLARDEMYGYQLVEKIAGETNDLLQFREGCIYPILHRMVAEKLLLERSEIVAGRKRRYYRVSLAGKKKLRQMDQRWFQITQAVNQIETPSYPAGEPLYV